MGINGLGNSWVFNSLSRRGGGLPAVLKAKFSVLWLGGISNDELNNSVGDNNIAVTSADFTSRYIPSTSSATFALPDIAGLKTDDEDNLWYDAGGAIQQLTVTDLVGQDYTRTVVKYANFAPYNIAWIGLIATGETFTASELEDLHKYFQLWILWSGTINNQGVLKDNRTL